MKRRRWGSNGAMNAISLGFVATAILISMFLIMAIFEHIIFTPQHHHHHHHHHSHKLTHQPSMVPVSTAVDLSIVMPGEKVPSHIASPAPLPCRREGIRWPPHL